MTAEIETTAVAVRPQPKAELVSGHHVAPIIPRTIDEVARIAKAVIVAGLAPDSYRGRDEAETASKIMVGIMKGAEVGLAPLTALANIAIINGKPGLYGDGAVALVQRSGKVTKWSERYEGTEGQDDFTAICEISREGQSEPYAGKFSWGDAKRAKLTTKGPWLQYPSTMLMWRARTKAMRTGFADFLSGLGIVEELNDIPAPPKAVEAARFLDDSPEDAETTPETPQQPDTAVLGSQGAAENALASEPENAPSEALARGLEILSRQTKKADIEDLHTTISAELDNPTERITWDLRCSVALGAAT